MFTRCQGCHTVHPVNAALLAAGRGRYRCGKCGKVANALESLFDAWPDAGEPAAPEGQLPELGARLDLDGASGKADSPEAQTRPAGDEETPADPDRTARRLVRLVWITAAVVVTVIAGLNLARYFDVRLIDQPELDATLERAGLKDAPPAPVFRDLDQIGIVSREVVTHPHRVGLLLLNATLVNRAERPQPFPDITLALHDLDNRVIARYRFGPGDYLSRTTQLRDGMTPGAYVGLSLEIEDPGGEAVGFEIEFH